MELLYKLINFAILFAILYIFGKKTVISIFRTRRKHIAEELDKAYEPQELTVTTEETQGADIEKLKSECEKETDKIIEDAELLVEHIKNEDTEERLEMRRVMIEKTEAEMINGIYDRSVELFTKEPYMSRLRSKEPQMAEDILKCIKLTPGDIAYLKEHGVLYVTLVSAYPLDEELVASIEAKTEEMLSAIGEKQSFLVKVDPSLIGGLSLRIGDTLYDCTVAEEILHLKRSLKRTNLSGCEDAEALTSFIRKKISDMKLKVRIHQVGRVITVSDGICWADGLADIMYGEVVEFEGGTLGMVLDIKSDKIGCIIFGSYEHIESGCRIRRAGRIASVPVGDVLLGRVVDSLGHAIDGRKRIRTTESRPIECKAPEITERRSVYRSLHTGIKAVDALVPIGRGQRELIIGDRQTGKTAIAIDTIINQKGKGVICIYVAIGQKDTTVAEIRDRLEECGAMEYTTIVSASASKSASLQYIAPFAATAMGEYFMRNGKDVLIIYDDLSKHAIAYRELSLLLHRPSGREAYPGDIFYLHSRLLERSAQLSDELGGGSMTALPIIETQAGDISSYIPTNVISITDGQIFLDTGLFYEGQRPAVNVGLSVSRVGGSAQSKLMKQLSSSMRTNLAQYRELAGFAQFGGDIDGNTKSILERGERLMAALRQGRFSVLEDYKQVLILYAVSHNFTENVPVEKITDYENELYKFMDESKKELTEILKRGEKLNDEVKNQLDAALSEFSEAYKWQNFTN